MATDPTAFRELAKACLYCGKRGYHSASCPTVLCATPVTSDVTTAPPAYQAQADLARQAVRREELELAREQGRAEGRKEEQARREMAEEAKCDRDVAYDRESAYCYWLWQHSQLKQQQQQIALQSIQIDATIRRIEELLPFLEKYGL